MMRKYPRTRHVTGSRFGAGDEDLESVPFSELAGRRVVIEEKMDGANCAISFSSDATLMLQSRGHYLLGGPRERHFDLFKRWARSHEDQFFDVLGDQYVMYGEWMFAKHTVFYDALPHYFMEFDVLDLATNEFLDTARRGKLLGGLPVQPVKVLYDGTLQTQKQMREIMTVSHFITGNAAAALETLSLAAHLNFEQVKRQTDLTGVMEGLYIKVENHGVVEERLKFVRADFTSRIVESDGHWQDRPVLPNQLLNGVDIFADQLPRGGR